MANSATTKYEHESIALINQLHHKLPTIISLSTEDFYYSVNNEQVRLLCGLLTEEGYITCQPCDIILASELVNHVTDYLIRYKDNEEQIAKLVRLLLKPLGEYANPEEKISSARQQAVIANWLQYAVLGMSFEAWILKQISDIPSQEPITLAEYAADPDEKNSSTRQQATANWSQATRLDILSEAWKLKQISGIPSQEQKSFSENGVNPDEKFSSGRQRSIITDWLQYAVLSMSSDAWLLKKSSDSQSQEHSLLRHANLRRRLFDQLNSQNESSKLLPEICTYYQEHVLSRVLPIFDLQFKDQNEQLRLENMMLDQPQWGYLHAGALLLRESGAELNQMRLDDIINTGVLLETLIVDEKITAEYIHYFKLPALIHHQLKTSYKTNSTEINQQAMPSIYQNYFNELRQASQSNPLLQFINLLQNWQSRSELARQQLKAHDIDESWLNEYLYHNREVAFINRRGEESLLPNINKVFADQNQQIAKFSEQTEKILLPITFNSIRQTEQIFIEQADIQLIKAEFNAIGSHRSYPMGKARRGMAAGGLVTRVPESIDLLKCTLNGEKRIYALTLEQDIGHHKLYRVDEDKRSILGLFGHDGRAYDDDYKLKMQPILTLKTTNDKPNILFEKLAKRRSERLYEKLQKEGYQATTRQKVDAFFLSLIPLYTCITEAQKGNAGKAIESGLLDIVSFLPFIGKSAQVGSRFSVAAGEAAINGLLTALRQATIAQALREGGKQLIKFGVPHVMKSVPPKAYVGLGVEFIRSADPGFELLTSGGIKGLNSLRNAAIKVKQEINGLTPVVEAIEKQIKGLSNTPVRMFNTERAFRPDLAKEVQVVNIGQERGKNIWVQVHPITGALFGRKYLRDAAGNLELAPVSLREHLYHLKTQGMGGKGASKAARNLSFQSDTISTQLEKISLRQVEKLLVNRQANTIINLSRRDLSNMQLSHCFNQNIDNTFVNLNGANLTKSKLIKAILINIKLNGANLTEADLTNANLFAADLSEADLTNANLFAADLTEVNLNSAKLFSADLAEANLTNAKLFASDLTQVNLTKAKLCAVVLTEANLTKANLLSANLIDANLTKTNLFAANLTKSNLTNADLSAANLSNSKLINADLSGAKLYDAKILYANMHGAKLVGADLTKAHLTHANVVNSNFSNANLSAADLTEAELSNANFLKANLTEVNLTKANCLDTNLAGANLTKANGLEADLTRADLTGANLTNSNFTNTKLEDANLTNANLTKINLSEAELIDTNLANANLQLANLTDSYLINVNLANTNLAGVDFSGAFLRRINFRGANLGDANLEGVDIISVDFSGALLNNTLSLNPFIEWSDANLDLILNHFAHEEGSFLTSINSIDDRYRELKTKLALQLIHSLDRTDINLTQARLPLIEVLGQPPFIKNREISNFINKLIENYLTDSSLELLNNLESHPKLIKPFFNYFDQHPHLLASAHANSAFMQTILAARMPGINVIEISAVNKLYEKYLKLPEIQQQLQYRQIKDIFGDYEGNADWADKYVTNYLLLSPTKPGRVLVVSESIFTRMLHPDWYTKWDNIVLFQDGNCLSPAEYNLSQCYKQDFPLFTTPFINCGNQIMFNRLIESFDLNHQYKQYFLEAIKSNSYSTKLIADTHQQALIKIFSPLLDFQQGYSLKKQNYDQIINLYNLTSSTDREKAEHLLALSTVFTRYSSSAIFGTESDSPQILRFYAYALMEKAHNLDHTLIGQDKFNDWKDRLLGTGNAFTCTVLLSDMMIAHAKEHCNGTLKKIQPSAWR